MNCLNCNKEITNNKKYCSNKCQAEYQYKRIYKKMEKWIRRWNERRLSNIYAYKRIFI